MGIRFELPKQSDRNLSKILPERVDMSRLTGKEWDDLLEEILLKKAAVKKREESQKIMEREIEESLKSVDDLRAKTEEETELYRSKSELLSLLTIGCSLAVYYCYKNKNCLSVISHDMVSFSKTSSAKY